ncbi:RNA polymerase sigma factor [Glaciecola sp. 1036]|uniref:RNA polymerase sigma factor n=1 Tax=Alteromonadaceae TaxID=72275 RepID=UPI003D00562D
MKEFEQLYQSLSKDIFRFACFLCHDKELAQDIVAETFARAISSGQSIRGETAKAYLFKIARNFFLEIQNKDNLAKRHLEETIEQSELLEHQAFQKDQLSELHNYMQHMSLEARTALSLSMSGAKISEIAFILSISESAVKVKVFRARQFLSERLNTSNNQKN